MKKSKKLMILGLSAATAAVAATGAVSSFAWFAANKSVSATGMVIKASATETFLQIKSHNHTFESSGTATTDTWNDTNSTYNTAAADVGTDTINPTHAITSAITDDNKTKDFDTTGGATSWANGAVTKPYWAAATAGSVTASTRNSDYTDVSAKANTPTYDSTQKKAVSNGYTLLNQFDLRLRPNGDGSSSVTQPTSGALTASVAWAGTAPSDSLAKATRVLIWDETDTKGLLFTHGGETVNWATNTTALVGSMAAGSSVADKLISVYVYFDGQDASCYTNNVDITKEYSINVTFSVADANA